MENRHHNIIILDFKSRWSDQRWNVYPLLSSESESEFNYQSITHYVNSCNGFLFFFDENRDRVCICNPTSNECKQVRLPPSALSPPPGFNPFCGWSGLGFDSRSNDYKFLIHVDHILAGGGRDSPMRSYVELYSLKTDSWKPIADFPRAFLFTNPCVCADGSLYWLSPVGRTVNSFDLADETFSSFEITPSLDDSYRVTLVDCGGSELGLVAYKADSPYCFELWMWAAKSAGWNKWWDFSLPQIFDLGHRYTPPPATILGYSRQVLYLAAPNGEVYAYDCAANHLSNLQIRLRKNRLPVFISYVETTVSPFDPFLG